MDHEARARSFEDALRRATYTTDAHVTGPQGDCHAVRRDLQELLRDAYGITHTTLEVDHVAGPSGGAHVHCEDAHGPRHVAEQAEPHDHAGNSPCDH